MSEIGEERNGSKKRQMWKECAGSTIQNSFFDRFNCSDQMTYQTTAQIFMGLAQAGMSGVESTLSVTLTLSSHTPLIELLRWVLGAALTSSTASLLRLAP